MPILLSKNEIQKYYEKASETTNEMVETRELWPPTCARLRDPELFYSDPFDINKTQLKTFLVNKMEINWLNNDIGDIFLKKAGIDNLDLKCISLCKNRVDFINEGIDNFLYLFEKELLFIHDFISTIIWLIPNSSKSNMGNASFYIMPHLTFISDATFFFIPPFNQVPREFGILGFIENLYHEALHHQVHAYCAFTKTEYCILEVDPFSEILNFPYREDRTFNLFQAINACHVYGEITKLRYSFLQGLSEKYSDESLIWLDTASVLSYKMWRKLSKELFKIRKKFLPDWIDLIEKWEFESSIFRGLSIRHKQ